MMLLTDSRPVTFNTLFVPEMVETPVMPPGIPSVSVLTARSPGTEPPGAAPLIDETDNDEIDAILNVLMVAPGAAPLIDETDNDDTDAVAKLLTIVLGPPPPPPPLYGKPRLARSIMGKGPAVGGGEIGL